MPGDVFPLPSLSTKTRLRLAWALAPVFLLSAQPSGKSLALGIFPALVGIALRAWAASHIRKDQELTTRGPYAYLRHPLWTGSFLVLLGLALAGGQWYFVVGLPLLFLAVYIPAAREEEKKLVDLFGDAYRSYRAATPAVWPWGARRGLGGRKADDAARSHKASSSSCRQGPSGADEAGACTSHTGNPGVIPGSDAFRHQVPLAGDPCPPGLRLYFRNGEWQGVVGVAVAFLLLWLRMRGF